MIARRDSVAVRSSIRICLRDHAWRLLVACVYLLIPSIGSSEEWFGDSILTREAVFHRTSGDRVISLSTAKAWFNQSNQGLSTPILQPVSGGHSSPTMLSMHEPRAPKKLMTPRQCSSVFEDCSGTTSLPEPYCQSGIRGGKACRSRCQNYRDADYRELSFHEDLRTYKSRWKADMHALFTGDNAVFLGVFATGALILRNNVDQQVIDNVQQNGPYWGHLSDTISALGESFTVQIPLIAGVYAASLYCQDDDLHELSVTMLASVKFSVISSLALQYATGTHRSDNGIIGSFGDNGFPSTSSATSFALAAVIDERYGWPGAIPAYLAAGLVGWSEIDQSQSRLSDVVFGAALGYVIGKSLGSMHYRPDSPTKLVPFVDPVSGTQGLGFERRF